MLSKFFIDRPVFSGVLSILIVLLGAVAYVRLPVEQYPELAPPIVRVSALYPGATAEVIAQTVAAPLEQEINGVDDMIYMNSTSSDGRYELDVSFKPGADVDDAAVLVQNRVSIAEPRLPEEVRRLGVTTRKQSTALVGVLAVYSPDGTYDDLFLSNYVNINWRDEFTRIPGVGGQAIFPAKDYGMRIWLDPDLLKTRGLGVQDVIAAVRAQNAQVAAGAIGRSPAPAGTQVELPLTTLGRLTTPEQFADIIVSTGADGVGVVRLADVGRVELGARDYNTLATFNGQPAGVMALYQLPGANLTQTADAIAQKLEELKPRLPPGLEAKLFYDPSEFIHASQHEVQKTLVEAFLLVGVVVLVFLQSWRSTLIPMIAIPVSLIGAFAFMYVLGFSVNMLTLFGLVLAIGIVVDDAIVVVENVERNLAETTGSVRDATVLSMNQITGAIVAITLVLMAVFIPAAALPGITGTMFRQFALTIAAAVFFSAICALTLTPALCALLLRRHDAHHVPSGLRRWIGAPGRAFNAAFTRLENAYAGFSRGSGKLWPVTLAGFVGVLVLTGYVTMRVPTGFVPEEDLGFVIVGAQLPAGASLERTEAVMADVYEKIHTIEGVRDVTALTGFSVIDGQSTSYGNAWVVLDPWEERYEHGRDIEAILADINAATAGIQEARIMAFSLPPINGLGSASGFDLRLLDQGGGYAQLLESVSRVIGDANGQPAIAAAFPTFRPGVPMIRLDIDREKAMRFGVSMNDLFQTLSSMLGSAYVNDFNLFNRTYQVNVQADSAYRQSEHDILRLEVRNNQGRMVPLSALVRLEETFAPDKLTRYNLYPSVQVLGVPAPGVSSGQALSVMERVAENALPSGSMGYAWSTLSYQEKLVGNAGLYAFALAVLVVYLILAAQYESFITPLAVILSVPLVVLGAVLFLQWRGLDNNLFTQIGLVLLIGLGAKNAILIVEFARQNREEGMGIIASAMEAARTRLRPILMTSFAFILGVLPLVLATGAGAGARRSLGTAVFGGMVGVTVLGLVFTPALFVIIEGLRTGLTRLRGVRPTLATGVAGNP